MKINSKEIIDPSVNCETVEENAENVCKLRSQSQRHDQKA